MKVVYIASPCSDDKDKDLGSTKQACRQAVMEGHAFLRPCSLIHLWMMARLKISPLEMRNTP